MTAFYRQRIHPLVAAASVSVILVSLLGAAALTGVLPASRSALLPRTQPLPGALPTGHVATGVPEEATTAPTSVATLVSNTPVAPAAGPAQASTAAAAVVDPDLRRARDGAHTPDGAPVYESADAASATPGAAAAPAEAAPARSARHMRAAPRGSASLALTEAPPETRGARVVPIYRESPEFGADGSGSSGSSAGSGNAGSGGPGAWSRQHSAGAAASGSSVEVVTDQGTRVVEAYPAPPSARPDNSARLDSMASQRQNYLAGLRQDSRQDARQDSTSASVPDPTSDQAMRARRRSMHRGTTDEPSGQPAPEGVAARTGRVIGKTVGDTIDRTVAVIAGVLQGHKPVGQPSSQRYEPGTAADPLYR